MTNNIYRQRLSSAWIDRRAKAIIDRIAPPKCGGTGVNAEALNTIIWLGIAKLSELEGRDLDAAAAERAAAELESSEG